MESRHLKKYFVVVETLKDLHTLRNQVYHDMSGPAQSDSRYSQTLLNAERLIRLYEDRLLSLGERIIDGKWLFDDAYETALREASRTGDDAKVRAGYDAFYNGYNKVGV